MGLKKDFIEIDPVFGIEIECSYNPEAIGSIQVGSYHGDGECNYGNYFIVERDGSLRGQGSYPNTMELISYPFQMKDYQRVFDSFVNHSIKLYSKTPKITSRFGINKCPQLNDIFEFNESMGCHIHITPMIKSSKKYYINYKGKRFLCRGKCVAIKQLATDEFLDNFRNKMFESVKKYLPHLYKDFEAHYYRGTYSKKGDVNKIKNDRYCEFNLTIDNNRLEYRSFHLKGVKKWEEMDKMISLALNCAKKCFEDEINKDEAFKSVSKLDLNKQLNDKFHKYEHNQERKRIVRLQNRSSTRNMAFRTAVETRRRERRLRVLWR